MLVLPLRNATLNETDSPSHRTHPRQGRFRPSADEQDNIEELEELTVASVMVLPWPKAAFPARLIPSACENRSASVRTGEIGRAYV